MGDNRYGWFILLWMFGFGFAAAATEGGVQKVLGLLVLVPFVVAVPFIVYGVYFEDKDTDARGNPGMDDSGDGA